MATYFQPIYCEHCDTTAGVTPHFDPWGGVSGYLCEPCMDSAQEGSCGGFEDAMCAAYPVRHELQDSSGAWRR